MVSLGGPFAGVVKDGVKIQRKHMAFWKEGWISVSSCYWCGKEADT